MKAPHANPSAVMPNTPDVMHSAWISLSKGVWTEQWPPSTPMYARLPDRTHVRRPNAEVVVGVEVTVVDGVLVIVEVALVVGVEVAVVVPVLVIVVDGVVV